MMQAKIYLFHRVSVALVTISVHIPLHDFAAKGLTRQQLLQTLCLWNPCSIDACNVSA